jgi:D-alanine-D-alanine ligase
LIVSQKIIPRIAVVCGGPSAEAEVSRSSGKCVAEALRATYSEAHLLELDSTIIASLRLAEIDVVFPVLHGPPGENGVFQGFLEILGVPYVGSGVTASACAMDKIISKRIFESYGLPVAKDAVLGRNEVTKETAARVLAELGGEVVVKPGSQGSAVGVTFADNADELLAALEQAFQYDDKVLVEQRIRGKEITVAILEREEAEALPVIEILTPPGSWYDYEHRYTPGLSEHIIPAPLPEAQYRRTQEVAKTAHKSLGCRDLSRVDFVVPEQGEPILIEINTMPGMTPTSLYPDAARAAGISFEELVALLVEVAFTRKEATDPRSTT